MFSFKSLSLRWLVCLITLFGVVWIWILCWFLMLSSSALVIHVWNVKRNSRIVYRKVVNFKEPKSIWKLMLLWVEFKLSLVDTALILKVKKMILKLISMILYLILIKKCLKKRKDQNFKLKNFKKKKAKSQIIKLLS